MTTYQYKQLFVIIFSIFLCTFVIYDKLTIDSQYVTDNIIEYESTIEEFTDVETKTNSLSPYAISESGKNFIKRTEALSLTSYWDATGYAVGYGHHGKDIHKDMVIDSLQAEIYFDEDMQKIEKSVERLIKALPYEYNFSQGFVDGLSSLVYNCGETGVRNTEFYKRLKQCRVVNGKMNHEDWIWTLSVVKETKISHKGHITRRAQEYAMMLK